MLYVSVPVLIRCISVFSAIIPLSANAEFQLSDDDGPQRGTLATYSHSGGSVTRLEHRIGFDALAVGDDPRIRSADVQRVLWEGQILIRDAVPIQLHAEIAGQLTVRIDGEVVFHANSSTKQFITGDAVDVGPGDHEFSAEFEPASRGSLRLYWSSEVFTLEPLPPDIFFVEDTQMMRDIERGRILADEMRCAACHGDLGGSGVLQAPALDRVRGSQSSDTLVRRLQNPRHVVANSRMPEFGLSQSDAQNIAAFLMKVSRPEAELKSESPSSEAAAAGHQLLHSVGCAACHSIPRPDDGITDATQEYAGPELVSLWKRRSPEWVSQWLRKPETLNPGHRMPVFDLSNEERTQIVAALFASEESRNESKPDADVEPSAEHSVVDGETLVRSLNCAACHQIPGIKPKPVVAGKRDGMSCIAASHVENRTQPQFAIEETERQFLTRWITAARRDGIRSPTIHSGAMHLRRKGCLSCHDRDLSRGLSANAAMLAQSYPGLKGMAQALIPPALTAVGDKLQDDYLRTAVAGKQKTRRLPWLNVRMPRYSHSDADEQALVGHLIHADRLPDAADAVRGDILAGLDPDALPPPSEAELLTGNQLVGALGFNCVACHSAGPFSPRNVALGTRGSDIMTMGSRIRTRFFLRWMKNPIRVVPGIEMPAIRRPAAGVAGESLPRQIALMWRALRDEQFTPPTVTSQYEQFLSVRSGERPRIIRDVFTIGTGKEQIAVPRAMAIGFENGHSLLLDLDSLQWMRWTFGDFARQRTEGKSWYWDMAGVPVADRGSEPPRFIAESADGRQFEPVVDEARVAELVEYRTRGDAVEFRVRFHMRDVSVSEDTRERHPHADYSAWYDPEKPTSPMDMWYTVRPMSGNDANDGWQLSVRLGEESRDWTLKLQNVVGLSAESGQDTVHWSGALAETEEYELRPEDSVVASVVMAAERVGGTLPAIEPVQQAPEPVTTLPGFAGRRLPLDTSIMPTAIAMLPDGRLAFTSLKGHVWIASDADGDGLHDSLSLFEEGLASPFGILVEDDALIVAHKPEVLRLTDSDGDGRADVRTVTAAGWGYSDNYHDWSAGIVRDGEGNLFVGLGSDYSDRKRSTQRDRWRGGIVRVNSAGHISPVAMAFRYPMGLAVDRDGNLFATDNQGVQNTFNEINLIEQGGRYGVPSQFDTADASDHELPALAVPHPWARSVNSILFFPDDYPVQELRGHGLGCEYDNRFLMRFTTQRVNGQIQGCSYPFSLHNQGGGGSNFIGPICSHLAEDGSLYIGSIWDSGWQGGRNTGGITRLVPAATGLRNGIREVRAVPTGFEVEFFADAPEGHVGDLQNWSIRSYTREWSGEYASPDSDERIRQPASVTLSDDGRTVSLTVSDLQKAHMYHITLRPATGHPESLWPSEAHYWMRTTPQ